MMVSPRLEAQPRGGRVLFSTLALEVVRGLGGSVFELPPQRTTAMGAIKGHLDGVSPREIDHLTAALDRDRSTTLFLDGSNLGEVARRIRARRPGVRIVTLCHNVEARFFLGAFRDSPRPRSAAVLIANYLAERKAVASSDRIIAVSQKDRSLLHRIYGREATDIVPLCVRDAWSGRTEGVGGQSGHALFVGGAFYANVAGVRWWVKNVASRITRRTVVVGRGFERLRDELGQPGRVDLVGGVGDLEPWYMDAAYVIAPIFDGSGMKTKVAEGLMFGKTVIGTPEAFIGYEQIARRAGRVCRTAEDFVRADAEIGPFPTPGFDLEKRRLYEEGFSKAALQRHLEPILRGER